MQVFGAVRRRTHGARRSGRRAPCALSLGLEARHPPRHAAARWVDEPVAQRQRGPHVVLVVGGDRGKSLVVLRSSSSARTRRRRRHPCRSRGCVRNSASRSIDFSPYDSTPTCNELRTTANRSTNSPSRPAPAAALIRLRARPPATRAPIARCGCSGRRASRELSSALPRSTRSAPSPARLPRPRRAPTAPRTSRRRRRLASSNPNRKSRPVSARQNGCPRSRGTRHRRPARAGVEPVPAEVSSGVGIGQRMVRRDCSLRHFARLHLERRLRHEPRPGARGCRSTTSSARTAERGHGDDAIGLELLGLGCADAGDELQGVGLAPHGCVACSSELAELAVVALHRAWSVGESGGGLHRRLQLPLHPPPVGRRPRQTVSTPSFPTRARCGSCYGRSTGQRLDRIGVEAQLQHVPGLGLLPGELGVDRLVGEGAVVGNVSFTRKSAMPRIPSCTNGI